MEGRLVEGRLVEGRLLDADEPADRLIDGVREAPADRDPPLLRAPPPPRDPPPPPPRPPRDQASLVANNAISTAETVIRHVRFIISLPLLGSFDLLDLRLLVCSSNDFYRADIWQ